MVDRYRGASELSVEIPTKTNALRNSVVARLRSPRGGRQKSICESAKPQGTGASKYAIQCLSPVVKAFEADVALDLVAKAIDRSCRKSIAPLLCRFAHEIDDAASFEYLGVPHPAATEGHETMRKTKKILICFIS